jgi:DNA-binding beta-propeller fold protein YncE
MVTPVNLATRAVGTPITMRTGADAIAITPDGRTAYVTNPQDYSGTVTPIDLATGVPGRPIDLVQDQIPTALAISPDGATVYVTTAGFSGSTVPTLNPATIQ